MIKIRGQDHPDFDKGKSKYDFDDRIIRHIHLKNGDVVRLDTMERYSGKIPKGKLTNAELDAEIEALSIG